MKKEEKDLLLKDLSSRLPYGVKCYIPEANDTSILAAVLEDGENTLFDFWEDSRKIQYWHQLYISEFKPYLFPLSSITKEQEDELHSLGIGYGEYAFHDDIYGRGIGVDVAYKFYEWCYKNNVDFLGLIPMGLAIDATGLNIY